MAKILDLILVGIGLAVYAALFVYKLVLMHRYRNDPEKLNGLVWTDQVYPKHLQRFIYDEDYEKSRKASVPKPGLK